MTELERIEIEGFKGLESVAFEPSQINLITGRNNTGKTSLLEAIHVLSDPNNLDMFSRELGSVVNVSFNESVVDGEYSNQRKQLRLSKPSVQKVEDLIIQVVLDSLSFQHTLSHWDECEEDSDIEWPQVVEDVVYRVISKETDYDFVDALQNEFLLVSLEGEVFPYFAPSQRTSEFLWTIEEELQQEILEDFDGVVFRKEPRHRNYRVHSKKDRLENKTDESDEVHLKISSSLQKWGRAGGTATFLQHPSGTESAKFIKSMDMLSGIEENGGGDAAIRIDNIGDYLREHNIADGLKTFDLDYLVFEESSEGKYQVPYSFMGDGFKTIVGLLWELLDEEIKDELVLIEEPENHMHPGYVRKVVRFLVDLAREENVQLFITTHDNDFINDFFMENLTDEQREFLEEEFTLIQMEHDAAQVMDYETAEETLKDLHLDLRGL